MEEFLENAHCFNCEAEGINTPVDENEAESSFQVTGLVRCKKHLKEWKEKYGKNI